MTLTQVTTGGVDEHINIDSNTLKVDGTNNRVGVGTGAPVSPLHVSSSENRLLLLQSSDHDAYLAFQETDSSSSTANRVGSVSNGLYFNTAGAERLRIDSSGNVGIGATTLNNKLEVNGNQVLLANGQLKFADAGNSHVGVIKNSGASGNGQLEFLTGATQTEAMRLDSSGRLLIGTSSGVSSHPLLQVKGYVNGATGPGWMALSSGNTSMPTTNENMGLFSFFRNDGGESARIECEADANQSSTSANGRLVFMTTRAGDTSPTESMRINSSGRVSIGTSAANANLNVYGGASAALFQNSNTGTGSGDGMFVGNWGGLSASVWQYENDIMNFGTNNTEAMRIDNSQRLLIGTTSPRTSGAGGHAKLQIVSPSTSDTTVIAAKFQGNSGTSNSECLIACSAGYSISANDTEGHALFGAVREGNGNNAGFIVKTGTGNTERFRIGSQGVITTNTVQQHFDRGATTGNSSFTRDFTIGSTQTALVTAGFNHYGLLSYGCSRIEFAATGASFGTSGVHNQTSTPGGSWTISKPNNTTLRVTKNAGNYNGSGHWFIHIVAS